MHAWTDYDTARNIARTSFFYSTGPHLAIATAGLCMRIHRTRARLDMYNYKNTAGAYS